MGDSGFFSLLLSLAMLIAGNAAMAQDTHTLPAPRLTGQTSLEEALQHRRSTREFSTDALTEAQVGQLLWAAQGVTEVREELRTAPSAGALFVLEIYVVAGRIDGVPTGVYHYDPVRHRLERRATHDPRALLAKAAHDQPWIAENAALFVIAMHEARLSWKYGERAERYATLEAGHAAQNLLLQATALRLGAVPVGAFDDRTVAAELRLHTGERPVYLIPIGIPADRGD